MDSQRESLPAPGRAYFLLGSLIAAYIGVYLCRKNLTVAVPVLQKDWGLTKEQIGIVGSVSTVTYALGKVIFGPITDRLGGRRALMGSMLLVALFGAAGAFAPSLTALTLLYSVNRLFGSASWGAMVKLVPEWFAPSKMAFACGLLSLSFVFGGALAVSFGGLIARWTHDSWQAVLGLPSIVLVVLAIVCWVILPRPTRTGGTRHVQEAKDRFRLSRILELFTERKFLVVVALSFTLTLLRETFNFWAVDFIHTEGGPNVSSALAAFLSTPFDICGALGIVLMGWVFGRLGPIARQRLLASVLGLLALLLLALPSLFHWGTWLLAAGIGLIGFLVYGPYSLLAGVLAVEVRGKAFAATVSGLVDGAGYLAGFLSGMFFGRLLMIGGYALGFKAMAGLTLGSAFLSCLLYGKPASTPPPLALPADEIVSPEKL